MEAPQQHRTSSATTKTAQVHAMEEAQQQPSSSTAMKTAEADAMGARAQPNVGSTTKTWHVHAVLLIMQVGFSGHQLLSREALTTGLNQFVYTIYRNGIALVLMGPFAYTIEKKDRPPITLKLLFRFFLLGLVGIVGTQQLFLIGLIYTSATFTATIQNAIPMFTFLLALMLGIEKVRIDRLDGKAKLFGTAVCVTGALLMSVWKGPAVIEGWDQEDQEDNDLHVKGLFGQKLRFHDLDEKAILGEWLGSHALRLGMDLYLVGSICLLVNCISWAVYFIMLAPILEIFPAPMSIVAYMYFLGTLQVGFLMLVFTGGNVSWSLPWGPQLFSVLYAGVVSSGINLSIQSWAIQRSGPVLVSVYTPVQSIITAILSVVLLGESWYLGNIVGGAAAVTGLFMVTWGQVEHRKQDELEDAAAEEFGDVEYAAEDAQLPSSHSASDLIDPLLAEGLEREESCDQVAVIRPIVKSNVRRRPSFYDHGHHNGSFSHHHMH